MRIIVCDDCAHELKATTALLEDCRYRGSFSLRGFNKPTDVLNLFEEGVKPDAVFLDIMMPELSGIDLAKKIRKLGFDGAIVFLSAMNDFAVQSYKVKAFSYLLKPAQKSEVQEVLDEIEKTRLSSDEAGFKVSWKGGGKFVRFSEFIYVEVQNHHLYFHLQEGEVIKTYGKLSDYKDILLTEPRMAHNNRSFIFNMDYISRYEKGAVFLKDGVRISIPHRFEQFQNNYFNWMFEKM